MSERRRKDGVAPISFTATVAEIHPPISDLVRTHAISHGLGDMSVEQKTTMDSFLETIHLSQYAKSWQNLAMMPCFM